MNKTLKEQIAAAMNNCGVKLRINRVQTGAYEHAYQTSVENYDEIAKAALEVLKPELVEIKKLTMKAWSYSEPSSPERCYCSDVIERIDNILKEMW